MNRILSAACTLSLFACGGPEADLAQEEAALSRYVPRPTLCAPPSIIPNAVSDNDPFMAAHPRCRSGLTGAPGAQCYFADDCAHGMCMRDPNVSGQGVCGRGGWESAGCAAALGAGWVAVYYDRNFSPINEPTGEPNAVLNGMCTYIGEFLASYEFSQGPDQACLKNENCLGAEACVRHGTSLAGKCGFAPPVNTGVCPANYDFDPVDQVSVDLGGLCHL